MFVDVTLRPEGSSALPQDTVPRHFWLRDIHTSDKNGNAYITGTTNFKISFKIWLLMHICPTPEKYPGLHPPLLVAWGGGGGE